MKEQEKTSSHNSKKDKEKENTNDIIIKKLIEIENKIDKLHRCHCYCFNDFE